jgi:LysM repeat protein
MPKFRMPRPRKKLQARVRTGAPPMVDDYDAEEPQTKLSSAFIVVLLLHVVAVGGIYAFNSIKSSRKGREASPSPGAAQAAAKPPAAPPAAAASDNTAPAARPATISPRSATPAPGTPRQYFVRQGDTLTSIAKSAGVSVAELETANGLKPGSTLRINQPLTLPAKGAAKPAPETAKAEPAAKKTDDIAATAAAHTYTVKSGDRLLFIAKRFNVSPDELIAVNKIKDPAKLQVGQPLKIPVKKAN